MGDKRSGAKTDRQEEMDRCARTTHDRACHEKAASRRLDEMKCVLRTHVLAAVSMGEALLERGMEMGLVFKAIADSLAARAGECLIPTGEPFEVWV